MTATLQPPLATRPRGDGDADVIVVGAGHNGLTAACYLARAGLRVSVVEAAATVGGMTATHALIPEAPRHRINLCALDLALMVFVQTVSRELGLGRYGLRVIPTDPAYTSIDRDGASITIWRDPRRTADEIRRFCAQDADAYLDVVRLGEAGIDIGLPLLSGDPVRPAARALAASARQSLRHRRQIGELIELVTSSAYEAIDARFQHPLIRGLLGVLASSMGPLGADGSGAILAYMAWTHRFGVGRIAGGTQAFPDALARCLTATGGTIRTASPVDELLVGMRGVAGVRMASGEELRGRAVLAACDPHQTLNRLLPAGTLSPRLAARAAHIPATNNGALAIKLDLALSGRVRMTRAEAWRGDGVDMREPFLEHGTIEQQVAAHEQASRGHVPDFIPYMATIPTAADPSQAPDGQDTVYVYGFPIPLVPNEPWEVVSARAAEVLLDDLAIHYEGIRELEIGRFVEPWPALSERTHGTNGHWAHVDVSAFRSGPLRPAIGFGGYRTPVPGLFLTGAGTHPGPGMSGMPGRLAARKVIGALAGAKRPVGA